ncbi:MAG: hypothetical protein R2828_08830 [Saprospiraceae bacterium]
MILFTRILLVIAIISSGSGILFGQAKAVLDSLAVLEQQIAQLPLTQTKSRGLSSAKSQYILSTDNELEMITIKDVRILNRNGEAAQNDGYIISVPLAALHKNGILIQEDKEKATVSMSVLASGNQQLFKISPVLAKDSELDFPQDRFLLGPWKNDDLVLMATLGRIQALFSWIAKKEGSKKKKQTPTFDRDQEAVFKAKALAKKTLLPGSKASDRSPIAAEEMDQAPLFGQARDLAASQAAVNDYILQQLKEKDIQMQFAAHGKFIVNEQGQVNFVRIDLIMDKGAKELLEDILKNMPTWKAGQHEGSPRSGLVSFSLKARN